MAAAPAHATRPGTPLARWYACGTVLAICVALLVGVGVVAAQWWSASPPGTAAPSVRLPIAGSVVLLSDRRTIEYSDPNGPCDSATLTAAQTRFQVVLSLADRGVGGLACSGYRYGPAQPRPASPLDPISAILPADPVGVGWPAIPLAVTLTSPLGHRRLVDALTGKAIPCFDERTALLLPPARADWTSSLQAGPIATSAPYFGGPGAAVLVDSFIGYSLRTDGPDGVSVLIVQVRGGGWHPPPWTVTRHVVVRGRRGLAAAGIIVWLEAGRTVAVIGEGPVPRLPDGAGSIGRPPLSFARLMVVASALVAGRRS